MLTFGVPAFLLAGALAALVPVALHLIRRRPPERAPLPTARFLAEDRRTSVRAGRPTDLLLLALRVLLLLLAGAAFARPRWVPAPAGTSEVVLLDRSAGMRGDPWPRAVEAARRALIASDGAVRGELMLFDSAAERVPRTRITPALFDSLAAAQPSATALDYAAALRAIPAAARELRGADSVRVTLLSALRSAGWRDGMAPLRRGAWPGSIALPDVGAPTVAPRDSIDDAPRRAAVPGGGRFVPAALGATGWEVGTGAEDARLIVVLAPQSAADATNLRRRLGAGATVIVGAGAEGAMGDALPWTGGGAPDARQGGAMWIEPGIQLTGAAGRAPGAPKHGASILGAWDDGRPAVAAARVGGGCVVYVATALEAGDLPLSSEYPRALDRLARGCELADGAAADQPLDQGGRALLRGNGPAAVAANRIAGAGGGVRLGRWILGAALLVALVETALAYGRRSAA